MNLITVIPITKSKIGEKLQYFTAAEVEKGAIVTFPVRKKNITGIVTDTKPVEQAKSDIRNAPYEIRKLDKIKATRFFPEEFINSCIELAEYYITNTGAIIDALTSDIIVKSVGKIQAPQSIISGTEDPNNKKGRSIYAIQGDEDDRLSSWRSMIRQEFAKMRSVVIFAPTIEEVEDIAEILEKGIGGYTFVLHSGLAKKKLLETWQQIHETRHPILIVGTPIFTLLPRSDIATVIIEKENSNNWKSRKYPKIDFRQAIETVAMNNRQTLYLSDVALSTNTINRLNRGEIDYGSPFKWRSISNAIDILVNMKEKAKISEGSEIKQKIISKELERIININHEDNSHLFIYTTRRGLATTIVCDDCNTILQCHHCSSPVVLHSSKKTGNNFLLCHKCGEMRNAEDTCKYCNGQRLSTLGIGTEILERELRGKFPQVEIFRADTDIEKSGLEIRDIVERYKTKPGSILIGTEMVMPYLKEKIDHIAVASLDTLFAIPDYLMNEKIMRLLIRLRYMASKTFLVQTRRADEKVFEFGMKGNIVGFSRYEAEERERHHYPPFAHLIKITVEGKKDHIARVISDIQKQIEPKVIDVFPAFTAVAKGRSAIHGLIKLDRGTWPDKDLCELLRTAPKEANIVINPESLL